MWSSLLPLLVAPLLTGAWVDFRFWGEDPALAAVSLHLRANAERIGDCP